METSATPRRRDIEERQPTGWTVFAGTLLLIVGSLDALYGLAAIVGIWAVRRATKRREVLVGKPQPTGAI